MKTTREIPTPTFAVDVYRNDKKTVENNIGEYNKKGMRIYGANVTLARAIPDIFDGFKPVERRALYATAFISKAVSKDVKVLSLVGDVIHIHPHGDSSVEDTITAMSKYWENAYPLITIEANNGQPKGSPAAAARYIKGRISDYCFECFFKEWDGSIIEMKPSYNPDYDEPEYLISKYPNMLLRPSTGFCFSMATSIPAFNMEEAFNAVINLMKDPSYEPVLIPDMPSGCLIVDDGEFDTICKTGRGGFRMRADYTVDHDDSVIHIKSIPYNANTDKIMLEIIELKNKGIITGLTEIFDASNVKGVNLIMRFRKDVDLTAVMSVLYKKTSLQSTFSVQLRYIDNYEIRLFNLKQIMQKWIDNRRVVKYKYLISRNVKLRERCHILRVLIDIVSSKTKSEQIINDIKKLKKSQIVDNLVSEYDITTIQAKSVANMKVSGFSLSSLDDYRTELESNLEEIDKTEKTIKKPKKIDAMIIDELEKCIGKYNLPRRCKVIKVKNENLVSNTEHMLVFTKNGFVKKLLAKSKSIGELNDGDEPIEVFKANNVDEIVLFDNKGAVHTVKVSDITPSDGHSRGVTLSRYASIKGEIISVFLKKNIKKDGGFVFITKKGIIKKTSCDKYSFKASVISIVLKDDDELVSVLYGKSNMDIVAYTKNGRGLRFNTNSFSPTSRMSAGVIGLDLDKNDCVIGITKITKTDTDLIIITNKGMGKRCTLDTFEPSKRRGEVLKLISLYDGEEIAYIASCDSSSEFKFIMKKDKFTMKASDFPELMRNHYGKKIISVPRGESIVKVLKLN